jgi:hypothetical protein
LNPDDVHFAIRFFVRSFVCEKKNGRKKDSKFFWEDWLPKLNRSPFCRGFFIKFLNKIGSISTTYSQTFPIYSTTTPQKKLPWLLVHTRTRLGWAWSGLETKNFSIQERKTSKSFYHGVIVFHEQMKPHVDRSK